MLDLSIIIVGYNDGKFLAGCLESIYKTPPRLSFEIIYVDNNSPDNSLEIVKNRFPSVRIIENKENFGFSRANNQALKIYQGRYALLLNADTLVRPGAFDELVAFMDSHPRAGAGGPKILNVDGTPQHQGGLLARKFWLSKTPVTVDYVLGACLMVRREVIDIVGGMDENLFFSTDDLDWCRSIRKAGWEVYFVPRSEVIHFGGYTINKFSQRLFVEGFRGGLYFCKKHYGNIAYQIYRVLLAFSMLVAIVFTLPFFFFRFNKQKIGAYWQIFFISLAGKIIPERKNKTILLLSNGHAEDLTAAAIGNRISQLRPNCNLRAFPLVGMGKAYDQSGIRNLGLKKNLPSGGFAKEGLRHFLKDLSAGLPGLLFKQIIRLRQEAKQTDLVVAMGDSLLVALSGLFIKKPLIFIDGPKSVRIEPYWKIEESLMRRYCRQVIVQDKETAEYLKQKKIPALYLGSWVMDYVPVTGEDFGIDKNRTVIGILPGTREEAYDNLLLILEVFEQLCVKAPSVENILGLIASALDKGKLQEKIKHTNWIFSETSPQSHSKGLTGRLTAKSGAEILIAEGKFGDVCLRSRLIIGLAGIANEQAVAFGRPTVCFVGKGPQTTLRRWQEIQKITGSSMEILEGGAEQKALAILKLLRDEKKMNEMEKIGKASKPQWGAVSRIAEIASHTLDQI